MVRLTLCCCGNSLLWQHKPIQVMGKRFGLQEVGSCTECGAQYLDDRVHRTIEFTLQRSL
ncbi:hypothetical protein HZB02_06115 [Candidatus Woesearchaeota archaeon]|nr:hypothetical protein [Candidatus Woesearchaeota archaeon]